jgi:hypothetical protein
VIANRTLHADELRIALRRRSNADFVSWSRSSRHE